MTSNDSSFHDNRVSRWIRWVIIFYTKRCGLPIVNYMDVFLWTGSLMQVYRQREGLHVDSVPCKTSVPAQLARPKNNNKYYNYIY